MIWKAIGAIATSLVFAGTASAATISVSNGVITYSGDTTEANHVTVAPGGGEEIRFDDVVPLHEIGPGCIGSGADGAICGGSVCPGTAMQCTGLRLNAGLGDGNDSIVVQDSTGLISTVLNGGNGNDTLQGGHEPDTFIGGSGFDIVSYANRTKPITVSLGQPGNLFLSNGPDGEQGENDDVQTDIERVVAGSGGSTMTASCCAFAIANQLLGGAGNDTLLSSGVDRLGRGASDLLSGGGGNDTIQANDGIPDSIFCGSGTDSVQDDLKDTVGDPQNCESVSTAPVGELPTVRLAKTGHLSADTVRIRVSCPTKHHGRCHGRLEIHTLRHNRLLGSAPFDLRPGRSKTLVVRLHGSHFGKLVAVGRELDSTGRPKTTTQQLSLVS